MRALAAQRQKRASVSKNFPSPIVPTRQQQPTQNTQNNTSMQNLRVSDIQPKKISVSDAIGLISIRLSKLENRLLLGGSFPGTDGETNSNMQMVNKDTIINVVNRLDTIESEFGSLMAPIHQEFDEIQTNIQIFEDKLNEMYTKFELRDESTRKSSITSSVQDLESAQIVLELDSKLTEKSDEPISDEIQDVEHLI